MIHCPFCQEVPEDVGLGSGRCRCGAMDVRPPDLIFRAGGRIFTMSPGAGPEVWDGANWRETSWRDVSRTIDEVICKGVLES